MKKDEILEELEHSDLEIVFTKKDGSERIMKCSSYFPEDQKPKGIRKSNPNSDLVTVFDIEKREFRSFNVDSVRSVTHLESKFGLLQES